MKVYGPYLHKKEQRRMVIIIFDDGSRVTKSFARYLMENSLRRTLSDSEEVDHIDNDKLNDNLSNLQILTRSENARKSARKAQVITFVCPGCGIESTRSARVLRSNQKQGKAGPFCGRSCAGRFNANR